jgi:hypothetical protein
MAPEEKPSGAYGFRFRGVPIRHELMVAPGSDWPLVELETEISDQGEARRHIDDREAQFPLVGGGTVSIYRDPARATIRNPDRLSPDALVHPYLVPVAAVHGYWRGYICLHGGAVMVDGSAWGIVGSKGAGKSSLLAQCVKQGHRVLADDLLVLSKDGAFAGPRSLDLRDERALEFGDARYLGTIGERPRWRIRLGPVPEISPVAGWIFPKWADRMSVDFLSPSERLRRLMRLLTIKTRRPLDPQAILPLIALPAIELSRPRRWADLDRAVDAIITAATPAG